MSNFIKLDNLCSCITDGSHYSPAATEHGIPMLSVKDMTDYGFDYSECKKISEDDYERLCKEGCHPEINDILIAKDGSYLKHVFVVEEDIPQAILSSIGLLRPDCSKVNPYYIKYYLSSDFVKKEVAKKYVSGSALPRIILKGFKDIDIPYLSLDMQNKIVNVLKTFDDKIKVNTSIKQDLEEMIKAIFDYWFIQFDFPNEEGKPYKSSGGNMVWNDAIGRNIPESWTDSVLGNEFDITMGSSPKGETITTDSTVGMKFYQGNADFGDMFPMVRTYTTAPIRVGHEDDLLVSVRAPVGAFNISDDTCCLGRGLAAIHSKHYVYMQNCVKALQPFIQRYDSMGTTFGCIRKDQLNDIPCCKPPADLIDKFEDIVTPSYNMIKQCHRENNELQSLKTYLLPLLMNGQISFKED